LSHRDGVWLCISKEARQSRGRVANKASYDKVWEWEQKLSCCISINIYILRRIVLCNARHLEGRLGLDRIVVTCADLFMRVGRFRPDGNAHQCICSLAFSPFHLDLLPGASTFAWSYLFYFTNYFSPMLYYCAQVSYTALNGPHFPRSNERNY